MNIKRLYEAPRLAYLNLTPKRIFWEVIAPKNRRLTPIQTYDVVFDEKDLKIRGLMK